MTDLSLKKQKLVEELHGIFSLVEQHVLEDLVHNMCTQYPESDEKEILFICSNHLLNNIAMETDDSNSSSANTVVKECEQKQQVDEVLSIFPDADQGWILQQLTINANFDVQTLINRMLENKYPKNLKPPHTGAASLKPAHSTSEQNSEAHKRLVSGFNLAANEPGVVGASVVPDKPNTVQDSASPAWGRTGQMMSSDVQIPNDVQLQAGSSGASLSSPATNNKERMGRKSWRQEGHSPKRILENQGQEHAFKHGSESTLIRKRLKMKPHTPVSSSCGKNTEQSANLQMDSSLHLGQPSNGHQKSDEFGSLFQSLFPPHKHKVPSANNNTTLLKQREVMQQMKRLQEILSSHESPSLHQNSAWHRIFTPQNAPTSSDSTHGQPCLHHNRRQHHHSTAEKCTLTPDCNCLVGKKKLVKGLFDGKSNQCSPMRRTMPVGAESGSQRPETKPLRSEAELQGLKVRPPRLENSTSSAGPSTSRSVSSTINPSRSNEQHDNDPKESLLSESQNLRPEIRLQGGKDVPPRHKNSTLSLAASSTSRSNSQIIEQRGFDELNDSDSKDSLFSLEPSSAESSSDDDCLPDLEPQKGASTTSKVNHAPAGANQRSLGSQVAKGHNFDKSDIFSTISVPKASVMHNVPGIQNEPSSRSPRSFVVLDLTEDDGTTMTVETTDMVHVGGSHLLAGQEKSPLVDKESNSNQIDGVAGVDRAGGESMIQEDAEYSSDDGNISPLDPDSFEMPCESCSRREAIKKLIQCFDGHLSCARCVQDEAKEAITGDKKGLLKCPKDGCDCLMPKELLTSVLPEMVLDLLEEQRLKAEREQIVCMDGIVQCPFCEYAAELDAAVRVFACQNTGCFKESCRYCKSEMSIGNHTNCGNAQHIPVNEAGTTREPDTWEEADTKEKGFALVPVEKSKEEYKKVEKLFLRTLPRCTILSIQRLQNPKLWQTYSLQRTHMLEENGLQNLNEMRLFHGTHQANIDAICRQNLDWRLYGRNGSVYGQGTYFARDASYSNKYSFPFHGAHGLSTLIRKVRSGHGFRHGVTANKIFTQTNQGPLVVNGFAQTNQNVGSNPSAMQTNQGTISNHGFMQTNQGAAVNSGFVQNNQGAAVNSGFVQNNQGAAVNPGFVQNNQGAAVNPGFVQNNQGAAVNSGFVQNNQGAAVNSGFVQNNQGAAFNSGFAQTNQGGAFNSGFAQTNQGDRFSLLLGLPQGQRDARQGNAVATDANKQSHMANLQGRNIPKGYTLSLPSPGMSQQSASTPANHAGPSGLSSGSNSQTISLGQAFHDLFQQSAARFHTRQQATAVAAVHHGNMGQCETETGGPRFMFVVRVLVGRYTRGDISMRRPPPIPGDPHNSQYNSCVDNPNDPTIYVIFEKSQCYPEYIIEYK
ncbi:uncharacterized protein LOC106178183 [Lingula anatina]|uniref:Poly [ADP-ribose] polymerase n=1 Tax=Lingula anatina TaxID=7574 RepID=A0A1S3K2U0_LINAN|nr:uncharacterized protein LOC106178183 [Lingula anatina]XP_013416717.1 uncharacterized protein LOC106178183 [Lingula anatina]XP_013416719.1 uncharacterized protein LOC106178183 [Lingula anatina]XP_013416720.1 uncharacterized protein LOC106178183 [Lingula anatina]|eukprot:XP_013416716.1 uncharacterized protein LOC106178183 [Lingula anatina]